MPKHSRRKGGVLLIVIIAVIGGLLAAFWMYTRHPQPAKVTFHYAENNETIVNPARGFYTQLYYKTPEHLSACREEGQSLSLVTINLKDHMGEPIPDYKLKRLRTFFEEARKQQIMLLFRAAYREDEDSGEPELSLIRTHIEQLSEVINEYKDVVLVVQTGMIGLWGEWHGSVYLEDENALRTEAMKVVKWWLEYLDPSINLNLRRPLFIQTAVEEGLDGERLGMHNDALLATDSDMGTYLDRQEDLTWCESNLNGKVNGGEMPYVSEYTEPSNAIKEFNKLSLTYLNAYYNVDVLKKWDTQKMDGENALSYMDKHLGYRYYLKKVETTEKLYNKEDSVELSLQLGNSGFSSIQNRFQLYLVTDDGTKKSYIPLKKTNGEKEVELYQCTVELSEMKPFRLGLCYTDLINDTTKQPEEYAHTVQLANNEINFENGVNYFVSYRFEDEEDSELIPVMTKKS